MKMNRRDWLKTAGGVFVAGGLSALETINPYSVEAQAQTSGTSSIRRENGVVHIGNVTIFCNEDFMGRTHHRDFQLQMSNDDRSIKPGGNLPYVGILTGQRKKYIGVNIPHGRREEIQLTLRGRQHYRNDYTGLNIPQTDDFYNLTISVKPSDQPGIVGFVNEPNKTPEIIMVGGQIGVRTGSASMLTHDQRIIRNDRIIEIGERSYAMPLIVKPDLNILTGQADIVYTTRNGAFVRTR